MRDPEPERPDRSPDDLIERLRRHRAVDAHVPRAAQSAVAVVLREGSVGLEVLLMTRAQHASDPWSGHVSLPGGRRELDDPDLAATARRETSEELGIDLGRDAEFLCRIRAVQVWARGRPLDMDVTPFAFRLAARIEPKPGPEAREAFWLPLPLAASGELDGEHSVERDGIPHRLPCWRFENRVVWGLTHRVLCSLLRVEGA